MSADCRTSLVAALITCAVLATTASAARAQMGGDAIPHRLAPAPTEVVTPTSPTTMSDLGTLRLGLPLQLSASLAAYRWLAPAMGELGPRHAPAVNFAQHGTVRSAWWRKRN